VRVDGPIEDSMSAEAVQSRITIKAIVWGEEQAAREVTRLNGLLEDRLSEREAGAGYACAVGERSSRGIERRCREDVAFRVITGNQAPDRTEVHANASQHATRDAARRAARRRSPAGAALAPGEVEGGQEPSAGGAVD
jgi:hypothetical protein